jgi:hypothetical protein
MFRLSCPRCGTPYKLRPQWVPAISIYFPALDFNTPITHVFRFDGEEHGAIDCPFWRDTERIETPSWPQRPINRGVWIN